MLFTFSFCNKPCDGFRLVPQWLYSFFVGEAQRYFLLGWSPTGAILGSGMALGQIITVRQRLSIKALWLVANAIGLDIAFQVGMLFGKGFLGSEILIVGAIAGLTFGFVTALPLKYLLREPSLNTTENVWLLRLVAHAMNLAVKWKKQLLWIFGNAATWGIAMAIAFSVWYILSGSVYINSNLQYEIEFAWGDVIGGLILGVIVAFGQSLMLRENLSFTWKWMLSSSIGLFVCFILAKYLGQPVLQYSGCSFFCFGFGLPLGWLALATHIGITHYSLGGPIAGAIVGGGMALSQTIFLQQRLSIKVLWVSTSAISLALAFTVTIILSNDVLMTGVITGLLYGLATAIPLKRLSQLATSDVVANH